MCKYPGRGWQRGDISQCSRADTRPGLSLVPRPHVTPVLASDWPRQGEKFVQIMPQARTGVQGDLTRAGSSSRGDPSHFLEKGTGKRKNIPVVSRVDIWTKYQDKDILWRKGMKKERQRCGKHGTEFSTAVLVCVVCKQMTNDASWLLCADWWVLSFQNNICLSPPCFVLTCSCPAVTSQKSKLTSKINYEMFLVQVSRCPVRGSVMRSTMQSRLLMIAFDALDHGVMSQHK